MRFSGLQADVLLSELFHAIFDQRIKIRIERVIGELETEVEAIARSLGLIVGTTRSRFRTIESITFAKEDPFMQREAFEQAVNQLITALNNSQE